MEGEDTLTGAVIGAAIEVHRILGPGLLESVYEQCLCREFELRGIGYRRQAFVGSRYEPGLRITPCPAPLAAPARGHLNVNTP